MLTRLLILSTILAAAVFLPPLDGRHDVVPRVIPRPGQVERAHAYQGTITWPDTDGDGCADMEESGPDHRYGGQRDPQNPRDFYDLDGYSGVDFLDVVWVALQLGTRDGKPGYHASSDRVRAGDDPTDFARLGKGDGVIDGNDLKAVIAQFGDRCLGPQTYDLANLDADCEGNIREASNPNNVLQVPADGKPHKSCLLVRDSNGNIVDVFFGETTVEPVGEAGGISEGWHQTSDSVEREFLWPPDWLRCTPGFGFLPRVCAPQSVFAGLYMSCEWRYYDGPPGHVYDGVVELIDCDKWQVTRYPMSVAESYPIEWHWVVPGFQGEAETDSLIQYAPIGDLGVFQQLTYRVGIIFGPWNQSDPWTN